MTLHAPRVSLLSRRAALYLAVASGLILALTAACALYASHHQRHPRLRGTLAPLAWVPPAGANEREVGR